MNKKIEFGISNFLYIKDEEYKKYIGTEENLVELIKIFEENEKLNNKIKKLLYLLETDTDNNNKDETNTIEKQEGKEKINEMFDRLKQRKRRNPEENRKDFDNLRNMLGIEDEDEEDDFE